MNDLNDNEKIGDEASLQADRKQQISLMEEASTGAAKGGLIQFRIEDALAAKMQAIAEKYSTSPGVLARQWVTAQIKAEISQNESRALSWHRSRFETIKQEVRNESCAHFQRGAYFVLHVVPLSDAVLIRPGDMEQYANTLRPLRRVGGFVGRINHLGYESRTAPEIPAKAYLQVFRTGEVECVRPVRTKNGTVIDGTFTDAEIVDAASTACACLAGQKVALPYLILIAICGIKDWTISSSLQVPIEVDELALPQVEISAWDQIAKNGSIEPLAQRLHESLNVYWNAGGIAKSLTFDGDRWVLAQSPNF